MDKTFEPGVVSSKIDNKIIETFVNIPVGQSQDSVQVYTSTKQSDGIHVNSYCAVYIKPEVENGAEVESEWERYKENFYDNLFPPSNSECSESSGSNKSENTQDTTLQNIVPENLVKSEPVSPSRSFNETNDIFSNPISHLQAYKKNSKIIDNSFSVENVTRLLQPNSELTTNGDLARHEILCLDKDVSANLPRLNVFNYNNVCKICNKIFNCSESLQKHGHLHKPVNIGNDTKDINKPCELIQSVDLNIDEVMPYCCDICDLKFSTSFYLKRHKMCHSNGRPYQCDECSLRFKHINNLTQHKMIHNNEKPYKCPVCPFSCRKLSGLKRHSDNHNGDTPFKCEICSLSFKKEIVLKRHKSSHNTERRYECEICSSVFRKVSHLTSHKTIHTDMKLLKCEMCSSQFRRPSDLKRHMEVTHSERRAFSCDVCAMKFKHSCNLKRHKAKHCNGNVNYQSYQSCY